MSKIQDALQRFQSEKRHPAEQGPKIRDRAAASKSVSVESTNVVNPTVVVRLADLRDAGLMTPEADQKLLANQYRDIKRPLLASTFGRRATKVEDGNLIMVTSAISGEGKSFTSMNLALSIAREQDLTVLLVDADVAKPHLSEVVGLGTSKGLLDLLEGSVDSLDEVIYPTSIEDVSILPAGVPRPYAAELLSSARMESTLRQLADANPQRIVVFDSPPLLQSSESKSLLSMAGQVVFVVKAESTTQGTVSRALQELDDQKAVNLVLNQLRGSGGMFGGTYSYGYGQSDKSDGAAVSGDELRVEAGKESSSDSIFNS